MITYDLHVHTCLSSDADDNMTPAAVIDRAVSNGLDIVAVTDHNSTANVQAAYAQAKGRITFVPGVEIESIEEVHVICLFPDMGSLGRMGRLLEANIQDKENKPKTFGNQIIIDEFGYESAERRLLRYPTKMTIEEIFYAARQMGGVALYAHLDSKAYSALSALGTLPLRPKAKAVEFTNSNRGHDYNAKAKLDFNGLRLFSSDAHTLDAINTKENSQDLENYADKIRDQEGNISAQLLIDWIRSYEGI